MAAHARAIERLGGSSAARRLRPHASTLAFAALAIIAAAAFARQGRGLTFYYDEWNFVLNRRGGGIDVYLRPHVDHLFLPATIAFKVLFATVGLDSYGVYRALAIGVHLLVAALTFAVARRRSSDALALALAAPILLLGSAWQNVLMPLQISFTLSVAAMLGMLLALERRDRRGDVAAAALLALALSSSSLGIPIAIGAAVEVLWSRGDRRRRWWVVAAPVALYAVWYAAYGTSAAKRGNIPDVPHYVADAAAGALGGLTGLGLPWGRVLALAALIVVVRRLTGPASPAPRLMMLLTTALAYWALTAVARAELQEPAAVRYLYFGAVLVALVAAELAQGWRPGPRALALVALGSAAAVLGNHDLLRDGARQLRRYTEVVAPQLGALEILGLAADPAFRPDPVHAPDVVAGPYLAAVADLGSSPADSPEEIARRSPAGRAAADRTLVGAGRVVLGPARPAGTDPPPRLLSATAAVAPERGCLRVSPGPGGDSADIVVPPGGISVTSPSPTPALVATRRFGDGYVQVGTVAPGGTATLAPPYGSSTQPWVARISGSARICA